MRSRLLLALLALMTVLCAYSGEPDNAAPIKITDARPLRAPAVVAARFEDGSRLRVFRERADDLSWSLRAVRTQDGQSGIPIRISEGERLQGVETPEPPALATKGGRAAVAWFVYADKDSQVYFSLSSDAGGRFTLPMRLNETPAMGRVSAIMLQDGSTLVTWVDASGALLLRRISLNLGLSPITTLIDPPAQAIGGIPQLSLVKDYDQTPAQIAVTFITFSSKPDNRPTTRTFTLPSLSDLAGRAPCVPCDEEDAKATRGFALRGLITELSADRTTLIVQHNGIPGVMRAQAVPCKVDAVALPEKLVTGSEVLGRIERRGRDWWIFDLRLLQADNRLP